jgi:hypothetical protein
MKNNTRTTPVCKTPERQRGLLPREMETLCSDAIERIAVMLGVMVDFDDPEPALVAAVERGVAPRPLLSSTHRLVATSRTRFGRPREEVEARINHFLGGRT